MDRERYVMNLKMCWLMAMNADNLDTGELLEAMSTADTVAPVLDPTLWISKREAFGEDREIVEAVHKLGMALRAIKERRGERFPDERITGTK